VNTARSGRYRIVKTYVTDPRRDTVLVRIRFRSLTGKPYRVYVLHDPALSNEGDDDTGTAAGRTLVASDGTSAAALRAAPAFRRLSSGYLGASDGWTDLRADHRMDWSYARAPEPRQRRAGVGVGREHDRAPVGPLPPGVGARPLPGGDRAARRRGPRRREAGPRLPLRAPAEA
jgi:hypothetical protein